MFFVGFQKNYSKKHIIKTENSKIAAFGMTQNSVPNTVWDSVWVIFQKGELFFKRAPFSWGFCSYLENKSEKHNQYKNKQKQNTKTH